MGFYKFLQMLGFSLFLICVLAAINHYRRASTEKDVSWQEFYAKTPGSDRYMKWIKDDNIDIAPKVSHLKSVQTEALPSEDGECPDGYRYKKGKCVVIKVPNNAYLTKTGNDWECRQGYVQKGNRCISTFTPDVREVGRAKRDDECNVLYGHDKSKCFSENTLENEDVSLIEVMIQKDDLYDGDYIEEGDNF